MALWSRTTIKCINIYAERWEKQGNHFEGNICYICLLTGGPSGPLCPFAPFGPGSPLRLFYKRQEVNKSSWIKPCRNTEQWHRMSMKEVFLVSNFQLLFRFCCTNQFIQINLFLQLWLDYGPAGRIIPNSCCSFTLTLILLPSNSTL